MSEPAQSATAPSLGDTADPAEAFISAVVEALEAAGVPAPLRKNVVSAGEQVTELIEAQADQIQDLKAQLAEVDAELREERETRAKEAAENRKRIHEVETQVEEATDGTSIETASNANPDDTSTVSNPGVRPPETPLEDIVRVPEHLVEESLTANQQRARFVAKDVHEYTQSVPAGRAIRSSQLRQVLTAGEDGRIYTETVSRVIEFLNELGGDAVEIRETQGGERVVVFADAFVERIQAYQHAIQANHTVVTDQGVEG